MAVLVRAHGPLPAFGEDGAPVVAVAFEAWGRSNRFEVLAVDGDEEEMDEHAGEEDDVEHDEEDQSGEDEEEDLSGEDDEEVDPDDIAGDEEEDLAGDHGHRALAATTWAGRVLHAAAHLLGVFAGSPVFCIVAVFVPGLMELTWALAAAAAVLAFLCCRRG